ncbi:MAG TPA: response regulator transcription factor, partial [Frankiaceae bacterium]|nr:response regulator transcription factor [Frankiaceae bacterium]
MIRILIADDQELIRSGLRALLDRQPDLEVVGEAADGHGALALAAAVHPDVVLMDIRMPGLDGLAATEQLLAGPDTFVRVVLVTTFELDEYVYAGLKARACGFILKDAEAGDLIAAVLAVAHG